jgi:hypothetical protein
LKNQHTRLRTNRLLMQLAVHAAPGQCHTHIPTLAPQYLHTAESHCSPVGDNPRTAVHLAAPSPIAHDPQPACCPPQLTANHVYAQKPTTPHSGCTSPHTPPNTDTSVSCARCCRKIRQQAAQAHMVRYGAYACVGTLRHAAISDQEQAMPLPMKMRHT